MPDRGGTSVGLYKYIVKSLSFLTLVKISEICYNFHIVRGVMIWPQFPRGGAAEVNFVIGAGVADD